MKATSRADKSHSAEFMLKEYERLSNLRLNEVAQSEQRINFYLTILSVGGGAILVVSQISSLPAKTLSAITQSILIVLLIFGLIILNRLNGRNAQIRVLNRLVADVQNYFARRDPEIAAYIELHERAFESQKFRFGLIAFILKRLRGTLTDMIVISNGLICGGLVLIRLSSAGYPTQTVLTWTVLTFIGAIILLYAYHNFIEGKLSAYR